MSLDPLVARAARGPLNPEERRELGEALSANEAPEVTALAVAEALGGGQQLLSAEESRLMLERALQRRPQPAAPKRLPRLMLALAATVVAGLVAMLALKDDSWREKSGAARTELLLAAQRPGADSVRAVVSPAALAAGEALRLVVRRTEAGHATLWEEGAEAGRVWSGELRAGDTVLGPENGRTGLRPTLPGVTRYHLVVCVKTPPASSTETREDCEVIPFEVALPNQ